MVTILGVLFTWTWPIWAFVFVFSLVSAIKQAVRAEDDIEKNPALWSCVWASVSLAIIIGGMFSLIILTVN